MRGRDGPPAREACENRRTGPALLPLGSRERHLSFGPLGRRRGENSVLEETGRAVDQGRDGLEVETEGRMGDRSGGVPDPGQHVLGAPNRLGAGDEEGVRTGRGA